MFNHRYFVGGGGFGDPNRPRKLDSLKKQERHESPREPGNQFEQGFTRLSTADRETGARQPIGSRPAWPAYHED